VKRMTAEDKALVRGIALALAAVVRAPTGYGTVEEVLADAGITADVLRRAGTAEDDRAALAPALRHNRKKYRKETP
jgi:ATP phosphoribosyltransferase regulatory subunit HisZ